MVSALLFASRYSSQKSKSKIKGSKNNPHFLGSRPSIRPEPGPRFWPLKIQKYPRMLFAKWFYKFQVPHILFAKCQKYWDFVENETRWLLQNIKKCAIFFIRGFGWVRYAAKQRPERSGGVLRSKTTALACQHKPAHPPHCPQSFAPPACGMFPSLHRDQNLNENAPFFELRVLGSKDPAKTFFRNCMKRLRAKYVSPNRTFIFGRSQATFQNAHIRISFVNPWWW